MPSEPQSPKVPPAEPVVTDSRQPTGPLQPSSVIRVGSAEAAKIPDMTHAAGPRLSPMNKKRLIAGTAGFLFLAFVVALGLGVFTR